jgi:outer membrane protein
MGKRIWLLSASLFLAIPAAAQENVPVVNLDQCIGAALSNGDDNRLLEYNLGVSRAQHALNVSKNSLSLSGALGYGQGFQLTDNQTLFNSRSFGIAAAASTIGAQATASLAGPLTTVNLYTAPYAPATSSAKDSSTLGLQLNQVLWNGYLGGTAQATVDKSLLTLRGKELSADSARTGLIYRIRQAYYTMLSAQRTLRLRGEILDKQKGVLAQITAVYNLKQASAIDLKTAQINARSAEIDMHSAEHDLRMARIRLSNLMGRPQDSVFSVEEAQDPAIPTSTLADAVADGLRRRTDLKLIELSRQSSRIDLNLLRGQMAPTVSVNGSIYAVVDWTGKAASTANAGVKLAMPILDAGAEKNQEDALQRQMDAYDAQTSQLTKSIAADIQDAFELLGIQKDRLEVAGLTAESTDLQYRIVKTQYDNGAASGQDLITAAVNAANARAANEKARSDAQLAALQLLNVMGY